MRYFAMWSDPPFAEADKQWREDLIQSGRMCPRCGHLRPGCKMGNTLLMRWPGDYPLNGIRGMLDGWIVRSDLLALLGATDIGEAAPICLARGEEVDGFSYLLADRVLARGGPESDVMGACSVCGSVNYYPLPQPHKGGVRYLLKASISGHLAVYDVRIGVLALREDVYERVSSKNFPGLNFYELPIRDEPEDGLPADLKPYLTPEEQAAMGSILWRDYEASQRRAAAAKKGLEKAMEPYRRAEKAATMEEYYRMIYGEDSPQLRRVRERGEAHLPPPGRRK